MKFEAASHTTVGCVCCVCVCVFDGARVCLGGPSDCYWTDTPSSGTGAPSSVSLSIQFGRRCQPPTAYRLGKRPTDGLKRGSQVRSVAPTASAGYQGSGQSAPSVPLLLPCSGVSDPAPTPSGRRPVFGGTGRSSDLLGE